MEPASGSRPPLRAQGDTSYTVRRAFERRYGAGERVFGPGDVGDGLYVIQAGQVELSRPGPEGPRLVARLGPGEFFGEMGVLLGRPRELAATAASETHLLCLDVATFEQMCVEQPEVAIRVIQRLASRCIELEQRLAAVGVDDLLRPVVRTLVRHAADAPAGEVRLPLRLRQIASEAGLSMLEAHRAVGQLFERKLVRLADDALVVADREALCASLDLAD